MSEQFEQLLERTRVISDLSSASAVLGWDQETYMPDGAAEARAEQISTLSTLVHQFMVSDETGTLIEGLSSANGDSGLEPWQIAMVRECAKERNRSTKLPESFVREMSRATTMGQHSWKKARQASDFSQFRDDLHRIIELKRQHAEYLGYEENPYDALIDLYEPGMKVSVLTPVFERLREGTVRLLDRIDTNGTPVSDAILFTDFDPDRQMEFARSVVSRLGFDFATGRVDLSAHPFCTSFAIKDVRLTTRVFRDDLRSCFFGLVHEAGHGMYEQGIATELGRTLLAGGTSMGIHESQSLFWENVIARSLPFWQWAFPQLQSTFPDRLSDVSAEEFFRIVNTIQPSFIRVEADELTYNLHIIIRFEIERALLNGELEVDQIPEVWNDSMEQYLGIRPHNDAEGCLQDVHWSFGGQGYFPSYTLGKLYAAMFRDSMKSAIPDMDDQIARGEFSTILGWLRTNIHQYGRMKEPSELVQDICGTELSETEFLKYIEEKIDTVYQIAD